MAIIISPEKRPTTFGPVAGAGILVLVALILYVAYIIFFAGSATDAVAIDPTLTAAQTLASINPSSILENEVYVGLKEHVPPVAPPSKTGRSNPFVY